MHMVIRVIVYATDEKDAISNASEVLNGLCGEDRTFDYYTLFREGDETPVSGSSRWGELPSVQLVCAGFGSATCDKCDERFKCYTMKVMDLVKDGMKNTTSEFMHNIAKVRRLLDESTDKELFEHGDYPFKYLCHCLGETKGHTVWLYDHEGEGITSEDNLKNVLEMWRTLYDSDESWRKSHSEDTRVYVVPADVHY